MKLSYIADIISKNLEQREVPAQQGKSDPPMTKAAAAGQLQPMTQDYIIRKYKGTSMLRDNNDKVCIGSGTARLQQ